MPDKMNDKNFGNSKRAVIFLERSLNELVKCYESSRDREKCQRKEQERKLQERVGRNQSGAKYLSMNADKITLLRSVLLNWELYKFKNTK